MMRPLAYASFLSLAVLAVTTGCRGETGASDDQPGVDAPGGDDMRIQDVQSDDVQVEDPVTLRGVVVVAIDNFGNRRGNIYVMEPEGGPFSGVLVFGAGNEQVGRLAVGDLVDITGAMKDEYSQDDDDATVTELIPQSSGSLTVTKVGTGTVPAPHVLDALAFGRMDKVAREAEYEKWEGVLIKLENVSVLENLRQIGASGSNPDPTFRGFSVTGQLGVDSTLAEIPNMPALVTRGDCLASITGVGDYFYDYKVLPRATTDIVKADDASACPAQEADATACGDGVDNDADGFIDCMDFSCQQNVPACQTNTTVAMVQMGTATGTVRLNDVVVTGRDEIGGVRGLWVADSATAAAHNGVFVFTGNSSPDAAFTVGSLVDVAGNVTEYDNQLTEITNATITAAPGGGTAPTPLTGVPAGTLAHLTDGEPYEGVLVRLTNLTVVDNNVGNGRVRVRDGANGELIIDDEAFMYTPGTAFPAEGTIACLTGLMHWNNTQDERTLVPRNAGDIVATGTCD